MVQSKVRKSVVDALMALATEKRWHDISLNEIAERAGMTPGALRAAYDGRIAILEDFVRGIDERVLAGIDKDMKAEARRERLFDVLFSRFEALGPHKTAIRSLGKAARRDGVLALELNRIVATSMVWMLEAAGISASGAVGAFRAQGLALVWARVMRVWLDDDDPGLARTMAALDRNLRKAERAIVRLERLCCALPNPCRARRSRSDRRTAEEGLAEGHPS